MPYGVLADAVVLVHLLWIVFLFVGAYWGRRYGAVGLFHAGGLALAVAINVFGWFCPLTHLEVWLRARHDPSRAYPGSFIAYYVEELIYVEISQRTILILAVLLAGVNAWLYFRQGRVNS